MHHGWRGRFWAFNPPTAQQPVSPVLPLVGTSTAICRHHVTEPGLSCAARGTQLVKGAYAVPLTSAEGCGRHRPHSLCPVDTWTLGASLVRAASGGHRYFVLRLVLYSGTFSRNNFRAKKGHFQKLLTEGGKNVGKNKRGSQSLSLAVCPFFFNSAQLPSRSSQGFLRPGQGRFLVRER